jgi:hypothetical protein
MKNLRSCVCLLSVFACLAAHADWSNPELDARNLSKAQWNAIAKGDFAQCQSEAVITTRRTVPTQVLCNTAWDPNIFMQCQQMNAQRAKDGDQLQDDLIYGCMARKGWSFTAD